MPSAGAEETIADQRAGSRHQAADVDGGHDRAGRAVDGRTRSPAASRPG